jgi:VanZ family protein
MHPIERLLRLLVVGAWMALISYWSGQGMLPLDQPQVADLLLGFQHRLAHLVAYGVLGLLGRWALDGLPRPALLAVVAVSLFGAADEFHQSFTPGRRAAIDDWATDTLFAAGAVYLWRRLVEAGAGPWQRSVRLVAPLAVGVLFVVGVGLAIRPSMARPTELSRTSLRNAAHTAVDFARSTRDMARQLRSSASG